MVVMWRLSGGLRHPTDCFTFSHGCWVTLRYDRHQKTLSALALRTFGNPPATPTPCPLASISFPLTMVTISIRRWKVDSIADYLHEHL